MGATDIVIAAENLSKSYQLRRGRSDVGAPTTLREALTGWGARMARRLTLGQRGLADARCEAAETEEFWALREVSFELRRGEVLGILGRNGAGKSTLLKILSRITQPTKGRVRIQGRMSSLLEVGTGFHPELTGRENIYLNGAILGMSRCDIRKRFGEIVEFAELEKFLDTPVKRYSSGMYVRLAFAVAAHLEPEILVVDEVLAVGDSEFQKKCLGKMQSVTANEGRTVLFVSHNLGSVTALCNKGMFLENGCVGALGNVDEAVNAYLGSLRRSAPERLRDRSDRTGTGTARLTRIYFVGPSDTPLDHLLSGTRCALAFEFESERPLKSARLKFTIHNRSGQPLTHCDSRFSSERLASLGGRGRILCHFDRLPLSAGAYGVNVALSDGGDALDYIKTAFLFEVAVGRFYDNGRNVEGLADVCLLDHSWTVDQDLAHSEIPKEPLLSLGEGGSSPNRQPASA